jgi:hypothetical protein
MPLLPLLRLWLLRLCERPLLELRLCGLRLRALEALLERFEPLLARDEELRVERDFAPDELAFAPDELAFALLLEAEPLEDRLFACLLPELLLLAATVHPSSI